MTNLTFYAAFIATAVSVIGLSHIALTKLENVKPRNLSELAAAEQSLLIRFRNILLVCGVLFGITVYGFIVPKITHPGWIAIFGGLMIGGELLAAVIPARHKTILAHNVMAQIMAFGGVSICVLVGCATVWRS